MVYSGKVILTVTYTPNGTLPRSAKCEIRIYNRADEQSVVDVQKLLEAHGIMTFPDLDKFGGRSGNRCRFQTLSSALSAACKRSGPLACT